MLRLRLRVRLRAVTLLDARLTAGASQASAPPSASESLSWRLAASMALARLANAVADAQQTRRRAQSVAQLAAGAGLPRCVVDVRHEATHNELPSAASLEEAARQALCWLAERYWDGQLAALRGAGGRLRAAARRGGAALIEAVGADGRFAARALLAPGGLLPSEEGEEREAMVEAVRAAGAKRPQLVPCLAEEAVGLLADLPTGHGDAAQLAWWVQALGEGRCGELDVPPLRAERWARVLEGAKARHGAASASAASAAVSAASAAVGALAGGGGGALAGAGGGALAAAEAAHAALLERAARAGARKRKRVATQQLGVWTRCDQWEPCAIGDFPDCGAPPPPWAPVGAANPETAAAVAAAAACEEDEDEWEVDEEGEEEEEEEDRDGGAVEDLSSKEAFASVLDDLGDLAS